MYKKIFNLLDKKTKLKLIGIFFFYIISIFLDLISISVIPVLIGAIFSSELDTSSKFYFIFEKINNIDLNILLIFMFIIFFIKNISQVIMNFYEQKVLSNFYLKITRKLLKFYFEKNLIEHLKMNPSIFVRNIITETKALKNTLLSCLNILRDIFLILGIVIIISFVNIKIMIFVTSIFVIFQIFFSKIIKKSIKTKSQTNMSIRGIMTKTIMELFNSIVDIKLSKKDDFLSEEYQKYNKTYEKNEIVLNVFKKLPKHIFEVLSILIICFLMMSFLKLNKDPAEILIILSLLTLSVIRLLPTFTSLSINLVALKVHKPSIFLVSKQIEEFKKRNLMNNCDEKKNVPNLYFEKIKFKKVNFSYKKNYNIISDLNIDFNRGNLIGITGSSGSGKTTFLNLLLGLIEPDNGKIYINGEELNKVKKEWQGSLSYVPQNVFLIDDTISRNITFGIPDDKIDQNLIMSSARNACIDKYLSKDLSLQTIIGNNGAKISGGQKQTIAIARALYRKPEVLVLDEALNAMNLELQSLVLKNIKNLNLKLVIIVTHDIKLLECCSNKYLFKDSKFKDL